MSQQAAIRLFEAGDYSGAFQAFTALYAASDDPQERRRIFQFLTDAYYVPNLEEMDRCYRRNCALLRDYPYRWGFSEVPLEQLPELVFPVTEQEYCLYDRQNEQFSQLKVLCTRQVTEYFFRALDKPLFVENEVNLYHLQFLFDNVRRSEDYGEDNHIYLYYPSLAAAAPLLALCELEPLLEGRKFVFLFGPDSRRQYPVDFSAQFGLNFSATACPVRIEELKRLCFWYKHAYSGTDLGTQVLGASSVVQREKAHDFHTYSTVDGNLLYNAAQFREALADFSRLYTVEELRGYLQSDRYHIALEDFAQFLDWLEGQRPAASWTVLQLFKGYFLFHYLQRKLPPPRIAPVLLFDPHMWDTSPYNALVQAFPYHMVLTSVREPIMTFARSYMYGLVGWNEGQTKYIMASDYCHAQFLSAELLACYYGYRFEDLKQVPDRLLPAVCRQMGIPFETAMLETRAPATDAQGDTVEGFDLKPLHRNISGVLSEFDQIRLSIFYEPIHKYYGYPGFDSGEYPLSIAEVRQLFSHPFRFERFNQKNFPKVSPEELHEWVQWVLGLYRCAKPTFPKLIQPEVLHE